ncbi:hypothetical protein AGABI2DRAFT_185498 [Agaricus bisporus var. bisporus H97]|uniref:hypothetical protein n=1 Tax=Agaricus bisporus var. bisporus (strain H97 / ATCC MYA-4626 / FGSC 10389) TaxID=936046 RepID=UPI00029F5165|nr:hypothetical protein AGABI2DRAFT_185498 [Agaricus bisporus var. bisporus H97]EKV47562.1 hypothetical protein AGABI2DRAFT_185498 [Agaricus bisporus var. bisporus H97]
MPQATAASAAPPAPPTSRPRKRRWTRHELLQSIRILADLPRPLSQDLPLSPPASRPSSPAPGNKRKSVDSDNLATKRLRTSSLSDRHGHPFHHLPTLPPASSAAPPSLHFPSASNTTARSEPCEDGEVPEDPPPPPHGSAADCALYHPNTVPIRRPKRGRPPHKYYDDLHDKYYQAGRLLKYSGDARFWSTYPPSHKEYRPLAHPPPVNSLYHKHGGETWDTINAFMTWCKGKWLTQTQFHEAERPLLAFIEGRKMFYSIRHGLDLEMDRISGQAKVKIENAIHEVDQSASTPGIQVGKSQGTPPMLPSPASIAPTNSANSTPTTRDGGTPNTTTARPPPDTRNPPPQQFRPPTSNKPISFFPLLPRRLRENASSIPQSYIDAAQKVTEPIDVNTISELKDLTATFRSTASSMAEAQQTLNLATMARHFPRTFSRMVNSALTSTEEHEPDFEDEEGELFWPGQLVTGEGLGWVCLMGKAMIQEFGKAYGYRGLDGVVPKPNDPPKKQQQQPQQQRS